MRMIQDRTYYVGGRRVSDLGRSMRARRRLSDAWRRNAGDTFFPRALNPRYKTWYRARYEHNAALRAMYLSAPLLSGALLFEPKSWSVTFGVDVSIGAPDKEVRVIDAVDAWRSGASSNGL
jgi:hypothetical protein